MKKQYKGRSMTIYGTTIPFCRSIARSSFKMDKLTYGAKHRLKIMDWYLSNGKNVCLTSRRFGYHRNTISKWIKRYNQKGALGLNDLPKTPLLKPRKKVSRDIVFRIIEIRKEYPNFSKYKIRHILKNVHSIDVSYSTIGRILKKKGLINIKKSNKRKRASLRPKERYKKGLKIRKPGDLIQIDVKFVTLIGGRQVYQFTAIDVLTKKRILKIYSSKGSLNGKRFIDECIKNFGFKINAIQTDNGSEFHKHFHDYLVKLNILHYYTYPRQPKQNSYVERSHRSDEQEFYLNQNISYSIDIMKERIAKWEYVWNNIRPHEALNFLTPNQYLEKYFNNEKDCKNVIILQS
jgi:transposase InsO family protein